MKKKTTLVLGASENPERYSYLAIKKLQAHHHPVAAIGRKKGRVDHVLIGTDPEHFEDIDTVTLYLNAANQKAHYDYIFSLHPRRIIFNPGAENDELYELAVQKGIMAQEACTLVLLTTGQY